MDNCFRRIERDRALRFEESIRPTKQPSSKSLRHYFATPRRDATAKVKQIRAEVA